MAASVLASRAELAQRANLTFGGKRNVSAALGYADNITPAMYRMRYERGDIAASIVESYPKATWGAGASIFDDEDPENETSFEIAIKETFKRLQVWSRLLRLDIMAGLGRYGALLIGTAQDLEQEAKDKLPVLYLQPLSEELCAVQTLEGDTASERFGQPLYYLARLGAGLNTSGGVSAAPAGVTPGQALARRVHSSHILHFVEGNLADEVFGEPRLRSVWNRLDDLDKLVGGGGEAAWHRGHPGMQADFDPEFLAGLNATEQQALMDKISDQYEQYENNMRRLFKTSGVDLKELSGGPFPFDASARMVIAIIAAAKGIPQRKLLGSGIGEMTGAMEDENFNDGVTERRQSVAEPVLRKLIDHLIEVGQIPAPANGKYEIEWPEEDEMSEEQKAAAVKSVAIANKDLVSAGLEPLMLSVEIRDRYYGLKPIDPKDIPPPPPPPTAPPSPGAPSGTPATPPPPVVPGAPGPVVAAAPPAPWRDIHRVADAHAPRLEGAFRAAFDRVRGQVDLVTLEAALARGDRAEAERLLVAAVAQFGDLLDEELPAAVVTP